MDLLAILFLGLLLSLIPAGIAHNKGRSFFGWWMLGLLFLPVALLAALLISPAQSEIEVEPVRLHNRLCPHCAERIKREAKVCRYCGRDVPPDDSPLGQMLPEERDTLTEPQRRLIETAGYLLPPEDAETALRMLRRGGQTDAVAQLFLDRGTYLE